MTIALRPVTADDWALWRPVRLAALADAPGAFGSRLVDWEHASEHRWRTRLSLPGALDLLAVDTDGHPANGTTSVPGRHADPDAGPVRAVGMASGVPDADDPRRVELISMWVAPDERRRGVARALIGAVATWAAEQGARELVLAVVPDNAGARETYARTGFSVTDDVGEALPDGRHEIVMRRDLEGRP
ncbi:GNAT family N-acetyltransferase [Curtobacterium sp. DN_7.5]|uniref:GNAT family N-acetyltransferase n=1 Tax=Curtobacterium sp. DN_7.5 TaxID=3049047 RepID=UPI001F5883DD|nr:GNAT family N-acetyltransferase [Curtobacterium sp. DN_7.5]